MNIQPQDIDALIELFEASDWDEMHLKIQDFELFLSTDPKSRAPGAAAPLSVAAAPAAVAPIPGAVASTPTAALPTTASGSGAVFPRGEPPRTPANWVAVTAPNLGTFYRAPKPGAPSFVEIGQSVETDTEICLIEVMKLFTTLKAGVKGIVRQVCVEDGAMVEFGDTLFYVEPA
jgi:acetyl-CoA carboxylase biotin carboxyl carrier protein